MKVKNVLLSFNKPELTEKALRSLGTNTILVHNGSERCHIEYLKREFSSIDHVVLKENRGYSGGANAGLRAAFEDADWALFLTNDCILKSSPIPPSEPSIVSARITKRSTDKVDSVMGGVLNGRLKHFRSKEEWLTSRHDTYVPGSSFLMHREVFESLDGFDEAFGTYWEDVDLSRRAALNGFTMEHNSDFQVRHGVGKTCRQDPYYSLYLYHRNRRRFLKKHGSWMPQISTPELARSFKLIRAGRWGDLKWLLKAVIDS